MLNADPVLALLSRALDAAALRQTVHATNVANVDTEGYRRMEVVFSAEVERLNAEGPALDANEALQWAQAEPEVVESAESKVRLDQEMAQMAENAVRYQTLLGAIERTLGLLRYAAKEGREG
ncbi:MAG TPA: flagellar basal body rod protein FlgB [Steroidobacteraceae bacterium]|jgi:flagellar basal-body rod protein FlgB|nr:flagellar basal body rod protein FlgB [Steroidobacteraceae bacterium]